MPGSSSLPDQAAFIVLPGAGSAGLTWRRAAEMLGARVMPVPDEPTVQAMASVVSPVVAALPEPRVLIGASLGAMVALEVAREVEVQALVLIATGFGITVGDSLLKWVEDNPPDLFPKMARASIANRDDQSAVAECVRDFDARGQGVLLRHLRALGAYKPETPISPAPTLVIWGERDHSVPLTDHVELAMRCGGILAPIAGAAHKPFFERPDETVRWIRFAARWAAEPGNQAGPGLHPGDRSPL